MTTPRIKGKTVGLSDESLDRLLAKVQSNAMVDVEGRHFIEVHWRRFDATEEIAVYYQDDLEAEMVWRKGGVPKPPTPAGPSTPPAVAATLTGPAMGGLGALAKKAAIAAGSITLSGAAMSSIANPQVNTINVPPKSTGGLRMPPYQPERDERGFPVPQPVHDHAEVTQWLQHWQRAAGNYGAIVAEMLADWETRNPT